MQRKELSEQSNATSLLLEIALLNLPYQTLGSKRNKHRGKEQGGNPKGQKINIQLRFPSSKMKAMY
jgi:hypothetical protein